MRRTLRALGLAGVAALAAGTGIAQAQPGLVAPRPLTSPQPPQPTNAAGLPVEGWVIVRYSVRADGTPANVRAVSFMPPSIDPGPTVEAVSGWTFTPGLQNGGPIDWHNNETVVTYRLQAGPGDSAADFQQAHAAVGALLDAEPPDYTAALAANRALLAEHTTRLGEIGIALTQTTVIHLGRDDLHAALATLRHTTDPRLPILGGTELFPLVELRMQLENQLGRIPDALDSYNRLAKGLGPNAEAEFLALGASLRSLVETSEYLRYQGRIDQSGTAWSVDADRRFFYLDGITGTVRTIVAECDTRRIELAFNPDDDYGLPDSLGNCVVFVEGDPGTQFTFVAVLPPEE